MPQSTAKIILPDQFLQGSSADGSPREQLLTVGQPGRPRSEQARQASRLRHLLDHGPIDVSVCIVNWNCRDLLRQCLASLYDQPQGTRLETIVVDNASTDGAPDMIEEEFPEVLLLRNRTNEGFARGNNQAARRARGRYLLFLNNDTVVPPGALDRLLAFLESHPRVGMVGPRLRGVDGQVQVSYRPRPTLASFLHRTMLLRCLGLWRGAYRRFRRDSFDPNVTQAVDVLMGAAVMVPRQRFLAWGGWDETFAFGGEDLELSFRIGRQAEVVFYPGAEIVHYGSVSTRQNPQAATQIAIGFVQYFRKTGASPLSLCLYKLALTVDAPLQWLIKSLQYLVRSGRGQARKASQSRQTALALANFLRHGLVPFWRA